jgi:hypothetical protein
MDASSVAHAIFFGEALFEARCSKVLEFYVVLCQAPRYTLTYVLHSEPVWPKD